MNKFKRMLLQHMFKDLFTQSRVHEENLAEVFYLIRISMLKEFTEDNTPTLDAFMFDCIENGFNKADSMMNRRIK